jgi:hypothetical protein
MAVTLSQAQYNAVQAAVNLYLKGTAVENQLHVDAIDAVAPVAKAIGFSASTGAFAESAKHHPVTTLLQLAAFIGKP